MHPPTISIRPTKLGRGVFAEKSFVKNELIETAPTICDCKTNFTGRMSDYVFQHAFKPGCHAIAFGYGSMYNHSTNPSAEYIHKPNDTMEVRALCDIPKGDEILFSYGDDYWKSRGIKPK
jgi:hypothetical protein